MRFRVGEKAVRWGWPLLLENLVKGLKSSKTVWLPGERVGTEEKLWPCEVTLRHWEKTQVLGAWRWGHVIVVIAVAGQKSSPKAVWSFPPPPAPHLRLARKNNYNVNWALEMQMSIQSWVEWPGFWTLETCWLGSLAEKESWKLSKKLWEWLSKLWKAGGHWERSKTPRRYWAGTGHSPDGVGLPGLLRHTVAWSSGLDIDRKNLSPGNLKAKGLARGRCEPMSTMPLRCRLILSNRVRFCLWRANSLSGTDGGVDSPYCMWGNWHRMNK